MIYPHWNHQKIYGFLMILGGIEVNWFALFQSILRANFDNNPSEKPTNAHKAEQKHSKD